MTTTVRRVCLNEIRRRSVASQDSIDVSDGCRQMADDNEERRHDASEEVARINAVVERKLSPVQQKVFRMYVYEEKDYDTIASELGMTVEAARMNMSRARKTIKDLCPNSRCR